MPIRSLFPFGQGKQRPAEEPAPAELPPVDAFTQNIRPIVHSRKTFNKIFGIGFNKTATSTLAHVLSRYGYDMPNQQEQEIRLTRQCFATNYTEFQHFVARYDAFQDMPFSQGETYVAADALFPGSKFILTIRDPEERFDSMCRFQKKLHDLDDLSKVTEQDVLEKFRYLYPGYSHANRKRLLTNFVDGKKVVFWDKLYDKDYNIAAYSRRNNRIQRYFSEAPEKLLVIDLTKEKTTEKLCAFLNIPPEYAFDMPHRNKT